MKKCVFAGTFDPVTKGHEEIIRKCSELFDEVVVGLLINVKKTAMFPVEKRIGMLNAVTAKYKNVKVIYHDGLLVDLMKKENAIYYVRGLRNGRDYEYENDINYINEGLMPELVTLYVPAAAKVSQVSSTAVRELLAFDRDVSAYVPQEILGLLK